MYELAITDLPADCIAECAAPGPADAACARWRESLGFIVPRSVIPGLAEYGAWTRKELDAKSDDDLSEIVLWLACGDFAEYATECEGAGIDPRGERPDDFQPNCGSDVFTL